jgi:glycolate oxidase FAD binding subunit
VSDTGTLASSLRRAGIALAGDMAGMAVGGAAPECVALPASIEEVVSVLALARAAHRAVLPLGHGTEAACEPPVHPFVVLGTRRLTGVESYEPADLTLTAWAGTPVRALASVTADQGQWLPFDPPCFLDRTFGGLVAAGTSGPLSSAFGAVRDHVLGLTLVTGDGRALRLGGRVMKNVAGFDLVRAVVGSRGRLGVVVSATVRVFPLPEVDRVTTVSADTAADLLPLARRVATASVVPGGAILVERGGPEGRSAALLVRVLGAAPAVEVEERWLLGDELGSARTVSGPAAEAALASAREAALGGEVVLRASALPSRLPELLGELGRTLPDPALVADALTGRVLAGCDGPVDVPALAALRRRLFDWGGGLALGRAPVGLERELGDPPSTAAAAIEGSLRSSFDPFGTLDPGRPV